jgi:exonuclease SbcC
MRPVKLTLTAFGPFAVTQAVDFRQALNSRLFGIYGPTGAGKTSILDGLCFSLFGESSGQERQGDDLRSHHATAEVETEARLIFDVGAKRYHVVRRPRQAVQGKRAGLVERQHWAALYDATGLEVDAINADNPGVVLEERKVEAVADRLRAILGYSAAQFRQVVLLPQGQFRQLLTASSDERSTVLRGLFDVTLFERLVERLKGEAAELREEVEQKRATVTGHLQAHGVVDAEGLALLAESLKRDVGAQTETRDTARSARDDARTALQTAQQIEDRFVEYDAAAAGLREVQARAGNVERIKVRKDAADRAARCSAADSRASEAERELRAGVVALTDAEAALAEQERISASAVAALEASTARQAERDAAAAIVTQLKGFQVRVRAAESLRETADQSASALGGAQQALAEALAAHREVEEHHASAAATHQASQQRALRISQVDSSRHRLQQARERALSFMNASAAVDRLATARTTALANRDRLQLALSRARETEEHAEQALASAQAGHLAHKLEPGKPCPVCGSPEHPRPAGDADHGQGLDAAWREARRRVELADAEERQGAQMAARADGEWSQAVARLSEIPTPEWEVAAIEADLAAVEAELAGLGEPPDLDATAATVDAKKVGVDSALKELASVRSRHADADKAATSDAAALEASLADVPVASRTLPEVSQQLDLALTHRDQLAAAHQAAAEAERRASEAVQAARSNLTHAEGRVSELSAARDAYVAAFDAAKAAAGLSAEAYTSAKREIPELETFARDIADHAAALAAAQDRSSRATSAVEGAERSDVQACSAALGAADTSLAGAEELLTTTTVKLGQVEATGVLVAQLNEELATATERYRVVGELAQLSDGRNAHRLRLRDFAIAATFDLVLEAANQRFARMSRGRFALLRKFEGGDGRSRAGLDIEVYDAHTDQKRDAHTLSGGEGFLASLSLALGLSDVVQAEAGGVKLDAIFIDEGFGHLDDETLDVALDTLRDLVGQDRAVGVISHVDAVKEQIPMGFDVVRASNGSVVTVRAPGEGRGG